jgi:gamma-glutamyltranspeptidase/glutathione hydrolase
VGALHTRFGRLPLARVLARPSAWPATACPCRVDAAEWQGTEAALRVHPNATRTFLPEDRAPRVGEVFRNPDLAWSYEQIAVGGRAAFYEGDIAARLLACSTSLGGAAPGATSRSSSPSG